MTFATPSQGETTNGRRGPLDGLIVADLSRVLAGPYCSMLLGDLGATVIKVESPAGDDTRTWMPPVKDGVSTYYLSIGRNKRSITLDYRDPDDRAIAGELLQRADIAIENFRPGALGKFGLDYETAARRNPRLIYLSISGFGTAEGAWLPGYDLIVQAVSGLMSLTGDPDGTPFRAGISVFDVMAGLHGLIGVLAALHQRDETGVGQHVEVNLLSSAMSGLVNQTAAYTVAGEVPMRMGNAHPSLFPYETMPTADRDMIITAGNDRQFRSLCEVLGIPEVADDPRFATNADRTRNRGAVAPAPARAAGQVVGRRLVRLAQQGGCALRSDQHHQGGRRAGRVARTGTAGRGRQWRSGGDRGPQPHHVQRRRRALRAPTAGAG